MSKLGAGYLVINIVEFAFQNILNFLICNSFSLSKAQSLKTSQNVKNEAAKMQSVVSVNVWRSFSTPN